MAAASTGRRRHRRGQRPPPCRRRGGECAQRNFLQGTPPICACASCRVHQQRRGAETTAPRVANRAAPGLTRGPWLPVVGGRAASHACVGKVCVAPPGASSRGVRGLFLAGRGVGIGAIRPSTRWSRPVCLAAACRPVVSPGARPRQVARRLILHAAPCSPAASPHHSPRRPLPPLFN